ncbi:MAG: HNH endonuclease, partial [Betaproteobacteria bacterium]
MSERDDRLDQLVRDARRNAEARAAGYREQALKLYPWVCGL